MCSFSIIVIVFFISWCNNTWNVWNTWNTQNESFALFFLTLHTHVKLCAMQSSFPTFNILSAIWKILSWVLRFARTIHRSFYDVIVTFGISLEHIMLIWLDSRIKNAFEILSYFDGCRLHYIWFEIGIFVMNGAESKSMNLCLSTHNSIWHNSVEY